MEMLERKSAGFDPTSKGAARSTLSHAFKDETACGLISTGMNLHGDFDPRDELMFAGEELIINDLSFNSLDRVRIPPDMTTVDTFEIVSLTELQSFVQNYDEALGHLRITTLLPIRKLISLDSLWDEVETQVRAICLQRINKEINDLEPEPAFIIGLRALGNVLARQWSDKY
jgi:hypothetical protein